MDFEYEIDRLAQTVCILEGEIRDLNKAHDQLKKELEDRIIELGEKKRAEINNH